MPLRILHIASFIGNIGDNASHSGTYYWLRQTLGQDFVVDQWEIRKTYRNYSEPDAWGFDQAFIDRVNRYHLTIIGGGNYFEACLEDSATGTTIDLQPTLVKEIKRPLIFNGLGFDRYKGYSDNTLKRFETFLQALSDNRNILVSVRNDGSSKHLCQLLDGTVIRQVHNIPDPGFFFNLKPETVFTPLTETPYWAVNLAVDMPELRFKTAENDTNGYQSFLKKMAKFITDILQFRTELKIILIPHIYSDLKSYADLLQLLPDNLRRSRIVVAPYLQGFAGATYLFQLYQQAELVIGTRFHTNVCAIGMATPSIGLSTYPKLMDTYAELDLKERCVDGNYDDVCANLYNLATSSVLNRHEIVDCYHGKVETLRSKASNFYNKINSML